mmetsp:Transcript_132080/g.423122  ORF Transcript_132080/g.423122 Transcript_132080/m.423122 type:complete len:82 (+) Transcript_132080:1517-1762(+)
MDPELEVGCRGKWFLSASRITRGSTACSCRAKAKSRFGLHGEVVWQLGDLEVNDLSSSVFNTGCRIDTFIGPVRKSQPGIA